MMKVVCHECEKIMDYDLYRTVMRNGAFYHLDCFGNRATLMDIFFYSFAPMFESLDSIFCELFRDATIEKNKNRKV